MLDDDIDGENDAWLAEEAKQRQQSRVAKGIAPLSTLPTGRVAYRTLTDINTELQQLATDLSDRVKLFTLAKPTLLGKPIYGVEVSHNVTQNVGKPAFFLSGAHHAREWPTPEFTLEFVYDLLMHDGTDPDATNLLEKGKLIAVPVVNVDGYDLSRSLQNEQKRKNCRITSGVIPTLAECMAAANVNRGIDNNRNYLPFWGGPGSSTSATASNTRGEAPGSEPENQGIMDLLNRNPATVAINNHTPDQRLLRAPSSSNEPRHRRRPRRVPGLLERLREEPAGLAARPVDRRLLRGLQHRRAAGLLRARARSASRPRRRRASAARRRSTRRTRTSSTTTSAPAPATPARRCAASTTRRSRPRPSRSCTR